ncbi:MAG: Spermidine N(1)-acetyltransferase [Candidatus Dichloromethanomonas elyunquensis]|nr:MAG: Spermidine N(1)-acetyltransferase [Candidatus Dichloromethanomonas elyunquensis]
MIAILKGKITTVRPLETDDLDLLYEWYNDQEFSYWVSGNWPCATLLRRDEIERKMYEEDEHRYAVTDQDGSLIGTVGFDAVNIPARSARLYIGIGSRKHWSQGYGSDALQVFLRFLFRQWNFHRINAETWKENKRALACYQKMGFVREGCLREAYYINGKYYDAVILGLLQGDFTG